MIRVGTHGGYSWLTSDKAQLWHLAANCPEIVAGKFVLVTELDSAPFVPSEEEVAAGWVSFVNSGLSARITDPTIIPTSDFTEWYVFQESRDPGKIEYFSSYWEFGLDWSRPHYLEPDWDPSWDRVSAEVEWERRKAEIDRFWQQLERLDAESYIADGTHLSFGTNNDDLYAAVLRFCKTIDTD